MDKTRGIVFNVRANFAPWLGRVFIGQTQLAVNQLIAGPCTGALVPSVRSASLLLLQVRHSQASKPQLINILESVNFRGLLSANANAT